MHIRAGSEPDPEPMVDINTTPLVDVLLVLLIIFLITIPVVNSSIAVNLPREQNRRQNEQQENVIVTVDAQGRTWWFETLLPDAGGLAELLTKVAAMEPQPELHIRADARADYAPVGQVVQAAQEAGIARIGFLTEPPGR